MNIKINLLPPEKKSELKNLHLVGILFKIGTLAIWALLMFWVFLDFCLYGINVQDKSLAFQMEEFKKIDAYKKTVEVKDFFKESSEKSSLINSGLAKQRDIYSVIEDFNKTIPQGIILKEFSIIENKFHLTGLALNRTALLLLKESIEKNQNFEKIESPISNLVSGENVDFEFNGKIKKFSNLK